MCMYSVPGAHSTAYKVHCVECTAQCTVQKAQHADNMRCVKGAYKGGGGASPGDNFDGENFVTPPVLMQGHQTPEGKCSLRGKFRHIPNPWFLVDNMEFLGLALYLFRYAIGYFLRWPPILFISSLVHMS